MRPGYLKTNIPSLNDMYNGFSNCFAYYLDVSYPFQKTQSIEKSKKTAGSWVTVKVLVSSEKLNSITQFS